VTKTGSQSASASVKAADADSSPSRNAASTGTAGAGRSIAAIDGQKSSDSRTDQSGDGSSQRQAAVVGKVQSPSANSGFAGNGAVSDISRSQGSGAARSPAPVAEQVASRIAERAQLLQRGNSTELHVRLEPPELGTVHVHLQASEGTVSARLVASSPEARAALEANLPDLRNRLGSGGVNVGGLDVSNGQAGSSHASSGNGADVPQDAVNPVTPTQASTITDPTYVPSGSNEVNVIA
jgi:flagellar hook-length control protein FliK